MPTSIRGGAAFLLVAAAAACAGSPEREPPNVLLVSLDTTRPDHLSAYGYARSTSPRLELLAERGALFTHATAQMTITNPSHASMFTGSYPQTHHVGHNTRKLADEKITLTEILSAAGWQTAAFVSGHPLRAEITGLDQGFELYDSALERRRRGDRTVDSAIAWLEGRSGLNETRPFFLFVHLYDAHGPYKPPARLLTEFRSGESGEPLGLFPQYQRLRDERGNLIRDPIEYRDRYDAALRFQDEQLGRLLDALDLDRTIVIVLADHGETLFDRAPQLYLNHGTSVFEEQIAIPLVFAGPSIRAGRHAQLVETVDLLPTLLDLLELEAPAGAEIEGESLARQLVGERPVTGAGQAAAYASNRARSRDHVDRGYRLRDRDFIHSVRSGDWKLIRYPGEEHDYFELYDLAADPAETRSLAAARPQLTTTLAAHLSAWAAGPRLELPGSESEGVSAEEREQLRALGYVDQ